MKKEREDFDNFEDTFSETSYSSTESDDDDDDDFDTIIAKMI